MDRWGGSTREWGIRQRSAEVGLPLVCRYSRNKFDDGRGPSRHVRELGGLCRLRAAHCGRTEPAVELSAIPTLHTVMINLGPRIAAPALHEAALQGLPTCTATMAR